MRKGYTNPMTEERRWTPRFSRVHVHERALKLAALVGLAALLQLAAAVGMSYVVGFDVMFHLLAGVQWGWLVGVAGGLLLALVGSYYVTRGIYQVKHGSGPESSQLLSVVVASFGGFLAHGGAGLDKYAIKAAGGDERDADVRVAAFAGLEHGVLGLFGTVAGAVVLARGLTAPPPDFSGPWTFIPVPGFIMAFWLARRYRLRLRASEGWRRRLGVFLDSILLVRQLFTRDLRRHPAVAGMVLFWAAEIFAIWCGLAAFGFRMDWAQLVIGAGTGMLFTRRTGPLAGAGILMLSLSASIWYSGAPLATAVAGVFAYRVLALWLPMPLSMAQIPTLRAMGAPLDRGAGGRAGRQGEPALPPPKESG
jgi:hypothetical protein